MNPDEGSDIDVANEIKFGYSNDVDDKPLSGQLDTNVEEEASGGESTTEVLDEPGTGPVSLQDNPDQVKQADIKQLGTDVDDSATNVSGTDGDNQCTVVDISAKLVQLGHNVVDDVEAEKCGADVLGEIATEPVTIPDDHVENELCLTDIAESGTKVSKEEDNQSAVVADIAANLVPGDNVVDDVEAEKCGADVLGEAATERVSVPDDHVENELCLTDIAESGTKVSKEEDNQSAVVADIPANLVPGDNVVDDVEAEKCGTDVLGETAAEPVTIPDDFNISTTLVPDDKVGDLPPSGRSCSDCLITEDVHSSGAEATSARASSAGSPSECEEPRSGYVDIDSVKPAEQVSNVPSTRVANVSGKEGFPQPPTKVEGREFDNN